MEVMTKEINQETDTQGLEFKPYPVADLKLTAKIFDLLQQALVYKQVKKGINETIKMLDKDKVEAVILAADADPIELLANMPGLCEERSIPYCFVNQRAGLGRACGIKRPIICCCIVKSESSGIEGQIDKMKDEIELLFYS